MREDWRGRVEGEGGGGGGGGGGGKLYNANVSENKPSNSLH